MLKVTISTMRLLTHIIIVQVQGKYNQGHLNYKWQLFPSKKGYY